MQILIVTQLQSNVMIGPGYIKQLHGNWLWVDKFDGIKDQRGSRDNRC